MRLPTTSASWWGPPKKFDRPQEERRVSWLELFYDLVYVIAISRITHHFSLHITTESFFEYAVMFILIYWGWVNGSLYHDIHGNDGLRTRLMTLWQMVIIAALAVVIDQTQENRFFNIMVVLMIMQLYITYMWWSVGFYDKSHRRYNRPYTILYLISLALMALTLFLNSEWQKLLFPLIIVCNYAPPMFSVVLLHRDRSDIALSSSMFERMGLLVIIMFGEVVLGVVNGITQTNALGFSTWLNFTLEIAIVFALWWIFFTIVAQRDAQKGFLKASLLEYLFIPLLLSLGLVAVSFTVFFDTHHEIPLQKLGYAIATFLVCIRLMMLFLVLPEGMRPLKKPIDFSLLITAAVFLISTFITLHINRLYYLAGVLIVLVSEILFLNLRYMALQRKKEASN
ncbi:low temperature requirement protein A [Saccharicrinis sp. FJH62]|uniref:low temperature requirement protein A n=1 Tax=Saccharicrinis sp. FJH62 TaxID=3344657 RepID=UPI0035D4C5A7